MRTRLLAGGFIFACLLIFLLSAVPAGAQSLADLARKQRDKNKVPAQSATASDSKPGAAEDAAYLNMGFVAAEELLCKQSLGTYVDWEQLFAGCRSKGVGMAIEKKDDPRLDPNYEFRLTTGKESFELAVLPKREGLAGLWTDGSKVYRNPNGAATRQSTLVYPSLNVTAADTQSVRGKKVYTSEDFRGGSSMSVRSVPDAASGKASAGNHSWKPAELEARYAVYMISLTLTWCVEELGRPCTLNEIMDGVPTKSQSEIKLNLKRDLRRDRDYEYRIASSGTDFEVSATAKRSGAGGFIRIGKQVYFNPQGPASAGDLLPGKNLPDPLDNYQPR